MEDQLISGYPHINNIDNKYVNDILDYPVIVEEKVDGSQFSFRLGEDGVLWMKTKGVMFNENTPFGDFKKASDELTGIKHLLNKNYIYRGEYLARPRHNALRYERVPAHHVIGYDIVEGDRYLDYDEKKAEFTRIGLEVVPMLCQGTINRERLERLLDTDSILGGVKIEGVVIKHRSDEREIIAKFVCDTFKEKMATKVKSVNTMDQFIHEVGKSYRTEARWNKAVQHLRDNGLLKDELSDIGILMREVATDVLQEYAEEIKETLFKQYWKNISKELTKGLPEWYRGKLEAS